MPRRAARIDRNQRDIAGPLQALPGYSVAITSGLGDGFPDLVVGGGVRCDTCGHRRTVLLEIKPPLGPDGGASHSQLTPAEERFHARWRGEIRIVRSLAEALSAIGAGPATAP